VALLLLAAGADAAAASASGASPRTLCGGNEGRMAGTLGALAALSG
jgi:hypothetical protein